MARRSGAFSSPAAALFSGLGGGLNAGMGLGMESTIKSNMANDALMRQSALARQAQEASANRQEEHDIRLEKIRNILAMVGTPEQHDEAIKFLMMPEGTQASLRADVGNVGVNEVDPRTKATIQYLATAKPRQSTEGGAHWNVNLSMSRAMANMGKMNPITGGILPMSRSDVTSLVSLMEAEKGGPLTAQEKQAVLSAQFARGLKER